MKPMQVVSSLCRGFLIGERAVKYDQLQTSIYALGVGCCKDPFDEAELDFTVSFSGNFKVLPTFPVVYGLGTDIFKHLHDCPGLPEFNPMTLLHGEQKLEVFRTLPPTFEGTVSSSIVDVQDKKSGALVIFESLLAAKDGTSVAKNTAKLFIRGIGGFGDPGIITDRIPSVPKRTPDLVHSEATSRNQAVIYQLSGDHNLLHISKEKAASGGYERPILHGLCSMGFGTRAVLRHVLNYDVEQFRSILVRFTSHVFPGDTLVTAMWREGTQVIISMTTAERGLQVIQGVIDTSARGDS
jgi:acyl dehydratase